MASTRSPASLRVEVALKGDASRAGLSPIHAEAGLGAAPVVEIAAVGVDFGAAGEAFGVDAVIEVLAVAAAVAEVDEALLLVAAAGGTSVPVGLLRGLGDDVDDAVDGVRSPDGAAGSADDFDAIDVFEQGVLHFPVGAGEQRACRRCGRRSGPGRSGKAGCRTRECRSTTCWHRCARPRRRARGAAPRECVVAPERRMSSPVMT